MIFNIATPQTYPRGDLIMGLVGGIIGLTLGVIVGTTVLIPTVKTVNTTGWTTSEITILGLATLGTLLGLGYAAFSIFGMV